MAPPVRVAVVGAGVVAQVGHLPMIARREEFELVGICDNDLPKARSLATRFEIPEVFDDIEYLLSRSKPDAVAVCTPNHLHQVHVKTALAAGVHVLCERPLALTVPDVEDIIAAQQRADKVVLVGMQARFRSDVQAVKQFLGGGELGTLQAVRTGWYTFSPARQALGWRRHRAQSGGGAMLDLGLPLIDLALWMLDWPTPCHVSASLDPANRDPEIVEDSGVALITCDGGASIVIDVSWHYVGKSERYWFELLGSGGSGTVAPLAVFKEMHGSPVNVTPTGTSERKGIFNAAYMSQWAHFAALIRGEVERPDLAEQLAVHRVLEAVFQSAEQGSPVKL
jgi:predicted dehydrogenase